MKKAGAGAVFLTVVVDLVGFGIVLPLLPRFAERYGATPGQLGLLMASFSAMQFLFAPIWGRLSDRVGRRPVLLVGLAGSVVFYTMFGFADSLAWLFAARIGAGLCGATISISAAYIADVTKPEERARGMALIGAAFGIGFTVGPVLGGLTWGLGESLRAGGHLPGTLARALPGLAAALLCLASFLWTLRSVPEPERHGTAARRLLDLQALRDSASLPGVPLLLGLLLLSVFAFSQFEGTLSLMLEHRFGYDERHAGFVFLFVGVVLMLVQGFLVRRYVRVFGERVFARAGLTLMAAGLAGVAFADRLAVLLPALAVAVAGFGAVNPSFTSLLSRSVDGSRQGGIMGLAQSAAALGRILGPWVGNLLYGSAKALRPGERPLLDAAFGDLEHHRRPYVAAAAVLAVLALAALGIPAPRDAGPPAPPLPPG
jgi:MFS family permease